jgi:hypothetical protein
MDEHQEPLEQRAPLLPTGVPHGVDEAPRSTRSTRQTCQVQKRIGHEDQTPVCPNGFGTVHAILTQAQLPHTVLIERFSRVMLGDFNRAWMAMKTWSARLPITYANIGPVS